MVLKVSYVICTTCSSTSSAIEAWNSCPADAHPTVHAMDVENIGHTSCL